MRRRDSVQLRESSVLVVYVPLLITIFLLFTFAGLVFADGKKTIYVSFDFEGEDFSEEIWPEVLDGISTRIAEQFVKVANEKYGYLNWVIADPPDCEPASPDCEPAPAWKIKLMLVNHNRGTSGKIIHEGSLSDGPTELNSKNLYQQGGYIPFSDPDELELDISNRLELDLNDILGTQKVTDFLSLISLIDNVFIDTAKKWVIIPVKYLDLKSDNETILTFRFLEAGDEGQQGFMTLQPRKIVRLPDYPYREFVRGKVTKVEHTDMHGTIENGWNSSFETIIPSVTEKKVYMAVYSPQVSFGGGENHGNNPNPND